MTLQQLLDYIDARIKQNGNREITAPIDNDVRKKVIEWVNDSIGNLDQLDTSVKTSIVAAINSSLGDFIIKDKGIELSAGKTVVNISGGSANSITITGHYAVDFGAVTNKPEGFDGWAFLDVSQYVNGASTIIKQVAIDEGKFAWRTIENGTANDWQFVGQGSGYTGANNKLPVYDSGLEGLKDSVVEQINAQTLKIGSTTVNFATLMTEVAKIANKSNIGHTHEWSTILNKPYDIWTGRQYDASPEAQINYNAWLTDKFEASEEYSDALFIFYTVDHRDFDDWVTANGYDGSDFEVQKTAYLNVPANVTNFQRWQNGELPGMTNPGIALFAESTAYTDAYELFIIGYTYEDYANSDEWIDDFAEWKLTAGLDVEAWLDAILNEEIDLSEYIKTVDALPREGISSSNLPVSPSPDGWYTVAETSTQSRTIGEFGVHVFGNGEFQMLNFVAGVAHSTNAFINILGKTSFNAAIDISGLRILVGATGDKHKLQVQMQDSSLTSSSIRLKNYVGAANMIWECVAPVLENTVSGYSVGCELSITGNTNTSQTSNHYVLNDKRVLNTDDLIVVNSDIDDLDTRVFINEGEIAIHEAQIANLQPSSIIVEVPSESFNYPIDALSNFRVIQFVDADGFGTVALNNITLAGTVEKGARLVVMAINLAISLDSSMGNIVVGGGSLTLNMGDNITLVYLDGVWNEIARTIN